MVNCIKRTKETEFLLKILKFQLIRKKSKSYLHGFVSNFSCFFFFFCWFCFLIYETAQGSSHIAATAREKSKICN